MVGVKELRLGPVGDDHARQADRSGPHSWRGVKAYGARDQDERGRPGQGEDECGKGNFHSTLTPPPVFRCRASAFVLRRNGYLLWLRLGLLVRSGPGLQ